MLWVIGLIAVGVMLILQYLTRKTGKHVPVTFYMAKDTKPGSVKTIDTRAYAAAQIPGVPIEVIPDSEFPDDPF